jgi:hypothetical protein
MSSAMAFLDAQVSIPATENDTATLLDSMALAVMVLQVPLLLLLLLLLLGFLL